MKRIIISILKKIVGQGQELEIRLGNHHLHIKDGEIVEQETIKSLWEKAPIAGVYESLMSHSVILWEGPGFYDEIELAGEKFVTQSPSETGDWLWSPDDYTGEPTILLGKLEWLHSSYDDEVLKVFWEKEGNYVYSARVGGYVCLADGNDCQVARHFSSLKEVEASFF